MIEIEERSGVTADNRCPKCGTALLPSTMKTRRTYEVNLLFFVISMERETEAFHPCEGCDPSTDQHREDDV